MTQRFQSQEHALISGILLGAVYKAGKELWGDEFSVEPHTDEDGDYQQAMTIRVRDRRFLVDIAELVIHEDPV